MDVVDKFNIHVESTPVLNAEDFISLIQPETQERTQIVEQILDKLNFDATEINRLSGTKHNLLCAISFVRSAKSMLTKMRQENNFQSYRQQEVHLSTEKFLAKINLLFLSLLRTETIPKSVYLDLFVAFLDICGIVALPGDVYERKCLLLGNVHCMSPNFYLLPQNTSDTLMNTLGVLTYTNDESVILRIEKAPVVKHSPCDGVKTTLSEILKRTSDKIEFPISRNRSPEALNRTPPSTSKQCQPSEGSVFNLHTVTPSSSGLYRKRNYEGRIKQPAVKLAPANGLVNKIPIIITLAPDTDDQTPGEMADTEGSRPRFETPGRKLNIPSHFFSGLRSALQQEFPEVKLPAANSNFSNLPFPILITTADATEAKLKRNSLFCAEEPAVPVEINNNIPDVEPKHCQTLSSVDCSNSGCRTENIGIGNTGNDETPLSHTVGDETPPSRTSESTCLPLSSGSSHVSSARLCANSASNSKSKIQIGNIKERFEQIETSRSEPSTNFENIRNSAGNNQNTSGIIITTIFNESIQTKAMVGKYSKFDRNHRFSQKQCRAVGMSGKVEPINSCESEKHNLRCSKLSLPNAPYQIVERIPSNRNRTEHTMFTDTILKTGKCKKLIDNKRTVQSIREPDIQAPTSTISRPQKSYPSKSIDKKKETTKQRLQKKKVEKKKRVSSDSGIDNSRLTSSTLLNFHGLFRRQCDQRNTFRESFIETDEGLRRANDYAMPVFTVTPQNSMYSFKINSEFQSSSTQETYQHFEKTGSNATSSNGSQRKYFKLKSIDWLLQQQLSIPNTSDFQCSAFDILDKSVRCSERTAIKNAVSLNEDTVNKVLDLNLNALTNSEKNLPDDFILCLLLEWQHSMRKPSSYGFLLHKTKVVVASVEMRHDQFEHLMVERTVRPDDSAKVNYTKVYDLLNKRDRVSLARIASQLSIH